jgi:hypothetical protein
MKQYLLSIYQPDAPPPPDVMARMDQIMADVNALVQEAKAAGAWVFNGALHAPSTATVVRIQHGDTLITDGPYAEGKEHIGGFLIVKAPDLDAALAWGPQARWSACGWPQLAPGRGASLPGRRGRPLTYVLAHRTVAATSEIERVFREQYARAVAVLVRYFGDIDLAEEAVQDAFTVAVQRWPRDQITLVS